MRRKGTRCEAAKYRHEDTCEVHDYDFRGHDDGRWYVGTETMTLCGHWFSICDDDPENRLPVWRWDAPEGESRVTCPHCLAMMGEDA